MLRKRLITALTFNNGVLFRTKQFVPDYRYTLNFVDAWSVDEVVLLDITRPGQGNKENFFSIVESFASRAFVPLAVGGGVQSIDDIAHLLSIGADKVIINTAAIENPKFLSQAARLYGAQCVVLSIDAKLNEDHTYEVYSHLGSRNTGLNPALWAKEAQELGAGEIFLNSIDRDGSLEGYDNALNLLVSKAIDIPMIACGGAGKWKDFVDGFNIGQASAVATTNIYHFTESSIRSAKNYLKTNGIQIRN